MGQGDCDGERALALLVAILSEYSNPTARAAAKSVALASRHTYAWILPIVDPVRRKFAFGVLARLPFFDGDIDCTFAFHDCDAHPFVAVETLLRLGQSRIDVQSAAVGP